MKKDSARCKKHAKDRNSRGLPNELDRNSETNKVDLAEKLKKRLSFLGNPVIPNLSGEYVAFEDLSNGKYHIKLWHVLSGAVFEVPAGFAFNAPVRSNLNVPNTPMNPEDER